MANWETTADEDRIAAIEAELGDLKDKRRVEHREAIAQVKKHFLDLEYAKVRGAKLEADLATANGLLDEVAAIVDVRPFRVDVGLELDAVLAKRREVE